MDLADDAYFGRLHCGSVCGSIRIFFERNELFTDCVYHIGGKSRNVGERLDYHLIKKHDYRKLYEEGEASACGVEAFLLIEIHRFLLKLLLCGFVRASCVLLAQCGDLRRERRLLDRVFLLLDCKGQHQYLDNKREQRKGDHVVARYLIEKLQYASEEAVNCTHSSVCFAWQSDPFSFCVRRRFFFLTGTGSYPPLPKGLQRSMRHTASALPLIKPHSPSASIAYCEQVGVKRQLGRLFSGEIYFR